MEKQRKMQRVGKNDGEERKRRQIMGTWLSLSAPRIHLCHICKECFPSLKALWGHQNAHRGEIKQKKQRKKVLEEARNGATSSSSKRAHRNNNNADAGNNNIEIELELRLGSHYPAPKFYDFMGVEQEEEHASASALINNNNKINAVSAGGAESEPIAVVDVTLKL